MNKKKARKKKHERQKKKAEILDSEIIGEEEEETLLGNLARVKTIPMIPWHMIPAMPTFEKIMPMPTNDKMEDWYKLFVETSENEDCDLIGFTPMKIENKSFEAVAPGTIGMAVQVREVERSAAGMALLHLKGICRYENLGFLPAPEAYFIIKVRWFEDEFEPEEIVRPHFYKHLETIERISRMVGESMKMYYNVSKTQPYDYWTAQYGSYTLLNTFDLFTTEEQIELLRLTSTSERLRRINERAAQRLPKFEKLEKERRKGLFN